MTSAGDPPPTRPVLGRAEVLEAQELVRSVAVSNYVISYVARIIRSTRPADEGAPAFVREFVEWGAGPRAGQMLILGGKARALLHGRTHVAAEDIQALAKPVLRHRLVLNFAAESEGVTEDDLVERLIAITPTKADELTSDARFQKIFAS